MADIVERLRSGAEHKTLVTTGLVNQAADEITRLRKAILTGVCMLSEMGLDPREKCEMAYDYLSAALERRD